MTLGAGLVLSGCGDDTPATTPAPAPPPPPPPAPPPEPEPEPPQAPATPTGLHVDETTQTSIEWHWNAVEGAIAYAVQISMDEMFDDTDQIDLTVETHYTVSDLEPMTSVYLRVAAAAGTLEDPIRSAWTTHVTGMSAMPPPPPPPPMAPATPTGLTATDDAEGSITWSWDAVEGADGYAIQVSMDEMFDDMDETTDTTETSHTVSDLGYGEVRYARVASTSGEGEDRLMSTFTTHATGMSMAEPPPPPPPAPDPIEVTFSLSDDAKNKTQFLIPVPNALEKNKEKATARVNTQITVESNAAAVITPTWIDAAAAVTVAAGSDNMPFAFVDWTRLQSEVISEGATFKVERISMGANQMTEPDGDVTYVTCGPWGCESGMDAPAFPTESMACQDWTWSLDLVPGFVDNTIMDDTGDTGLNDGVDVGWVYETNKEMTVTHHFGNTFEVKGPNAGKTSRTTVLSMLAAPTGSTTAAAATRAIDAYDPALTVRYTTFTTNVTAATHGYPDAETDGVDADEPACVSEAYDEAELKLNKPDGCFRVNAAGNANYLADYEVEVGLKGGGIPTWGKIAWPEFKDLKCPTHRVEAAMDVDVCSLFEEELTRGKVGTKDAWTAPGLGYSATGTDRAIAVTAAGKASARQFSTVWFDDDQDADNDMVDLYATGDIAGRAHTLGIQLLDDDGDPKYGDIGKVDIRKGSGTTRATDNKADNYLGTSDEACSDEDGAGCDAKHVIPVEVAFSPGKVFGCDPVEYTLNLECTWDAQGELSPATARADVTVSNDNLAKFLSCKFK